MVDRRSSRSAVQRAPRLLIVEDELLIALIIEEMARDIGYRVSGIAIRFDGQFAFEFADVLREANVPFAFVTGYDYLVEPRHELIPVLQKPFTLAQLRALLVTLVGSVRSNQQIARSA